MKLIDGMEVKTLASVEVEHVIFVYNLVGCSVIRACRVLDISRNKLYRILKSNGLKK